MSPCRIVIADDAPDVRVLLRTIVRERGFEVVGEAGNGVEAIEVAAAEHPDVVILDLSMPVMDGLEAMPRLVEAAPGTRVVVLSGFVNDDVRRKVLAMGAVACVEKGVRLDDLFEHLEAACAESAP